jgi:hypothetical protein
VTHDISTAAERLTTGDDRGPPDDPRAAAVAFITTEHFVLQGGRAATIAESTGRANMFLTSVSGALVALGLVATATRVGTTFYAFGLALLVTLTFVGLVTFDRVLQSGIEDHGYARRIALLRSYYFDNAPELTPYLLSVSPEKRWGEEGLWAVRAQELRTVTGMVGVVTAVLAGSATGLLVAVASGHSLALSLAIPIPVAVAILVCLLRYVRRRWLRAGSTPLTAEASDHDATGGRENLARWTIGTAAEASTRFIRG